MIRKLLLAALAPAVLFMLAGCSTIDSRIVKRQEAFNQLAPEVQERIRKGRIELGDSKDAVYIALGEPDRINKRRTAAGTDEVWVFLRSTVVNDSFGAVGHARSYLRDSRGRIVAVYIEPVHLTSSRVELEPSLRIVFEKGVVTEIEQAD